MNLLVWYRNLMRSVGATLVKLIATATSGLVSFTTNVIRPVKVTCEFSPIQEGTGDPSPDNVRPISGWTGCKITHRAANLIDINALIVGGISGSDGSDITGSSYRRTDYIYLTSGTYLFSRAIIGRWCKGFLYSSQNQGSMIRKAFDTASAKQATFTVSEPCYCRIGFDYTPSANDDLHFWEQGITLPITFIDPSTVDPLTVYGGKVTLNDDGSADLAVESVEFKISSRTWTMLGTLFRTVATDAQTTMGGQTAPGLMSSVYRSYHRNYQENLTISLYSYNQPTTIYISDNRFTTVQDFVSAMGNEQIVYPLAEPIVYHFDDNIGQLNSFLGENNILHDMNGSITAEYWNKQ